MKTISDRIMGRAACLGSVAVLLGLSVLLAGSAEAGTTFYVTPAGGGDGSSWVSPTTVADAFAQAGDGDQIWMQKGEYSLTATLANDHAIAVYGGFEGNEDDIADRAGGDVRSILIGSAVAQSSCVANACANGAEATVRFDSLAFRQGWAHGLDKSGLSNTELVNCEFSGNGGGPTAKEDDFIKGRGASVTATDRTVALVVTDCVFSNNVDKLSNTYGGCTGGGGLYVNQHQTAVIRNTDFVGNGVARTIRTSGPGRDKQSYGGGLLVASTKLFATNCLFVGNRMTGNGTGDGGSAIGIRDAGVAKAIDGSILSHCRIVANETCPYSSGSGANAGAVAIESEGGSYSRVLFDQCTIAYNLAPRGKHAGIFANLANVTVRNSIVYGNVAENSICDGCDIYATSWASCPVTLTVEYSLVGGTSASHVNVSQGTLSLSNVEYGDPLLATTPDTMAALMSTPSHTPSANTDAAGGKLYYTSTAEELAALVDVHLRSIKGRWNGSAWVNDEELSPALDKADPTADYALEPLPNGGRANLGVYGGTIEASKNNVAVPVISSASVAFLNDDYTRPHLNLALADDEDVYNAKVYFCYGQEKPEDTGTEGWFRVAEITTTAHPGDVFSNMSGGVFMPASVKLYWRVVVQAGSVEVTAEGETTTPANTPPQWGRGGDESVIHVWNGAQGTCGGTNWLDACTTLAQAVALVTETRTNIWVAGTVPTDSKTCEVKVPVTMLGGFTGLENTVAERPAGAKSVLDGTQVNSGLNINPTLKSFEYTLAHSLVADLIFTNMYSAAVQFTKRSSGTVRDCEFVQCGYDEANGNPGAAIRVNASATDTVTLISNCVFRSVYKGVGNGSDGYQSSFSVVSLETAKSASLIDCEFVNCGVRRTFDWNATRGREVADAFGLYVKVSSLFERCHFRGNVFTTHKDKGSFLRCVAGSAGTVFRNCEFIGNVGQSYSNGGAGDGVEPSFFCVDAEAASDYTFDSCTFAYNFVESCRAPIFNLIAGSVSVTNSILWGNAGITNQLKGGVLSATVANLRSTDARLSLDYCLTDGLWDLPLAYLASGVSASQVTTANLLTADPLLMSPTDEVFSHVRFNFNYGGNPSYQSRIYFSGSTGLDDAASYAASLNSHLRSRAGYSDPKTGELVADRRQNSPAIDAGDPESDWLNEPKPNGKRLNLGCWGNTPWASRTYVKPGLMMMIE